ncbi:MAG: YggS family pyridoxal phosphate-dependent enzyme [Thiotrichaceae bacterium]
MKQIICDHIQTIGKRIHYAVMQYQQDLNAVSLLAVSKRHPVSAIEQAIECGQAKFGENYAQEMVEKAQQLQQRGHTNIEWHFIGPIQANKTRIIAATAHWVHSIDRYKIARRLSEQNPDLKRPINLCLQVNVDNETSKSGVSLNELPDLANSIQSMTGVVLRGLMAIPVATDDFQQQRQSFAKVRKAMEALNKQGYNLDTLSMGMTGDMEAAIAEGATMVRIGTAIFGQRS